MKTELIKRDAGRLLSAVLEREQRDIRLVRGGDLLPRRRGDAEHAALLMHLVKWGFAMLLDTIFHALPLL